MKICSSHILYVVILYYLILQIDGFKRIFSNTDGMETEIILKVKLPSENNRGKRSAGEFPEEIDIDIPVDTDHVTLSLRRNDHISNRVPVTVQRHEKIIPQHLVENQKIGYYYDLRNGSAFMVQYSKDLASDNDMEFFGTVFIGSQLYIVQPPDENHPTHSLIRTQADGPVYDDYKIPSKNEMAKRPSNKRLTNTERRHKRQTTVYEVEVLIVVDFAVYSFWKDRASETTPTEIDKNAKKDLREYFALLLDAIDVRYATVVGRGYEINLLFAGIHIADTVEAASWTEPIKNDATDPAQVHSATSLENFRTWVADNAEDLPGNDHAMLFTGYDLEMGGSNSVAGIAYLGGLCGENKVSVCEEKFQAIGGTVAAHEVGHNLNSKHDGDGNDCPVDVGYVMESSSGVSSDLDDNRRLWQFSSCSQDYFDAFITDMNSDNTNCMVNRSTSYNDSALDEYADSLLGQIYPPDKQCGSGSYLCRQSYDFNYTNICAKMSCSALENDGSCWLKMPMEGTSCGNGKICSGGSCVTSNLAPVNLTDTCIFGDQPGDIAKDNKTCNELLLVEEKHYKCYSYDEQCCETCATVAKSYTHLNGCEYGDKAGWCSTTEARDCYYNNDTCCSLCPQYDTGIPGCQYGDKQTWCSDISARSCYLNDGNCCQHCRQYVTGIEGCQYGDKQTWCSGITARSCYLNDENCCQHCLQYETGIEGCKYGDNADRCSTLESSGCYSDGEVCCAHCNAFETGIPGCEYGDRSSACEVTQCDGYEERFRTVTCCLTCANSTTTITSTITHTSAITPVVSSNPTTSISTPFSATSTTTPLANTESSLTTTTVKPVVTTTKATSQTSEKSSEDDSGCSSFAYKWINVFICFCIWKCFS